MATDRPAYPQKTPTVLPAVVSEICGISYWSPEATNKMSVHCPEKQGMSYESLASRDWDLEQRCFNGRNIKKILNRGEDKGRITRLEVDMIEMASEECGRDPKDHFSRSQCDPDQRPGEEEGRLPSLLLTL